ncbi:MAG: cell division protein FtsQ/DivIB [Gammaproteobacteria bacterium]|nr:cell division protein FtsQ/DivIB [Gammaproteobacteria bacterium]
MVSRRLKKPQQMFWMHFPLAKFWMVLTCVLILVFCVSQLRNPTLFPVRHVTVTGARHIEHQTLQHLLLPGLTRGFFVVHPAQLRESILQFPWVADVSVVRSWPDEVFIAISEYQPVASWNANKLLSTSGEVFSPDKQTFPTGLPRFLGPEGTQVTVLEYYRQISKLLEPLGIKMTSLELTPWHSWNMVLENGIRVNVGYKDILTRIGHFVKVYDDVVGARAKNVDYVDLRYPDGFAVRWKAIS